MAISNTIIIHKKSGVSGNVPSTLANGEIAINYADGKLYYKNATGTITYISSGATTNSFATVNANSSLILATSNTDTLSFSSNNGISVTANTTSKTINISGNVIQALANSKMYAFFQNTAPSTANSHDLWMQSDSGVVYENWGTTSSPVWAEFGPTNFVGNTQPGSIVGTTANLSQINVSYTPATTTGAGITISAANTVGGTGYADVLKFVNLSGGATNTSKTIRLSSIGELQVVNSTYSITSMSLTDAGDMTLAGNTTINGIAAGYAPNRPAFRVYGANTSSTLSTTQNGTGQLNYNNWALDYNQGGYLNYTGGTFTAPVAGLYQISLNCRNAGNASFSQLICYKNSSNVMIMIEFAGSSTMNHTGGSTIAKLAVGDTLIIKVGAGTVNFDANDNWSVAYLG